MRHITRREAMHIKRWHHNYKMEHGCHFSDKLAEHVSGQMTNKLGDKLYFSIDKVKKHLIMLGKDKPTHVTWGDLQFSTNMALNDFYGSSIKTETDCVLWALDYNTDCDGYEGIPFHRWMADVRHEDDYIDWEEMI